MIAYWLNGFTIYHISSQLPSPWERAGVRLVGHQYLNELPPANSRSRDVGGTSSSGIPRK